MKTWGRLSRRSLLTGGALATGLSLLPPRPLAASGPVPLVPGPAKARLVGSRYPETAVWGYNGTIPGPEIRLRQGERLQVAVQNRLEQATTVHWHGVRLPNAMDGVPDVTQSPIAPGETFVYDFVPPDAGTYWYHPHLNSREQVARGLAGALIVEEAEPPAVDREELWVLDDWRLTEDAAIAEDFDRFHDLSHAGRIGNTVTLNGFIPEAWPVRAGERVRLRLVNVANARGFALVFEGHRPTVVAVDGQPCRPHEAPEGRVVLTPGARCDLIVDLERDPGERFTLRDDYYRDFAYRLLDIAYDEGEPRRSAPLDAPMHLPPNALPEPDLRDAERHELVLAGGAMGGLRAAMLNGRELGPRALAQRGRVWAMNGIAAGDDLKANPLFRFQQGRSQIITIRNDTAFEHPMHLHGHHVRLLSRNGEPVPHRLWHDTLPVAPDETVEVAFVADNPGLWMFHCHILEHQAAGMMAVVEVA